MRGMRDPSTNLHNIDNLHHMQFLRAMRRVAPDSKDWG